MNKKEIELFKSLCSFKEEKFNEKLLTYATPEVLGHLFFNRMQAIAYDMLKRNKLLQKVNREFRNSLEAAYEQNLQKNKSFLVCVKSVAEILKNCPCKVAMLKGAFLCAYYPSGYRTSNDIDLLVCPEDVTVLGNCLLESGFKQGHVKNGEFVEATRKEIITARMMRGETVPYIKKVDLPYMKYLEVDINFSLDYKSSESNLVSEMLKNIIWTNVAGINIPTLRMEDFFIHLCAHLYKEATTLAWIEMHRDMTLYKYCDIYTLLNNMSPQGVSGIFFRAKGLGLEKVCAYAILETIEFFEIDFPIAKELARNALKEYPQFLLEVISPEENKQLTYETKDVTQRFFTQNRLKILKEII